MTTAPHRISLTAALLWLLASCQSAPTPAEGPVARAPAPLSGIEQARADSARRPYTQADIRFMSGMIGHHAQAITMSRRAPTHDAGATVQRLAARIINAQQDEIALMQRWLADRRQPVPDGRTEGMRMTMNGMDHVMLMPGMLSADQMRQLDAARGGEFDRLFLTFMIQHHRGATAMVRELFATVGAAQDQTVFKLASDVNVDQTTEIARMESMLASPSR